MSDSPIESTKAEHEIARLRSQFASAGYDMKKMTRPESTKGLHESKERKPETIAPLHLGYPPYSPDGTETRREIIGAALWDAREHHPHFNVGDLGGYIEGKLQLWEAKRVGLSRGAEPETPPTLEDYAKIEAMPGFGDVEARLAHARSLITRCTACDGRGVVPVVPPRGEAETPTDTERLDWLEANPGVINPENAVSPSWNAGGFHDEEEGWGSEELNLWCPTLRGAIDKAMRHPNAD